jgi:Glycosyl hydrolase catalytic core
MGKRDLQYRDRRVHPLGRQLRLLFGSSLAILAFLSASASSASALPAKFFGVHWAGGHDSSADMEAIQRSGAQYFHLQISQTSNVSAYDPIFQRAWERGITILPYLYSGGPTGSQFPTLEQIEKEGSGPGTWIYFVYDVVHRYGFQGDFWYGKSNPQPVPAWEVWNEPNLRENNPGGASVYPESYTRFARRTAVAIQAAQKERSGFGTRVNFGNLFSAKTTTEGANYKSMNVALFLEKAANVDPNGSNFTGLALHPYSFTGGRAGVETNVNFAREKLNQFFGGSTKELWITELGWLAEGGDASHPASGEALQDQYLTDSFNWIRSVQAEKNIQALIYFNYHDYDDPNPSHGWAEHAGLRRMDGSYRPAWYAFQQQTGAPTWPTGPWTTENLGGNLTLDPAIDSRAPYHLDVFARGTDGALWQMTWNGSNWSSWWSPGGGLTSGPNAVSWDGTRVDVVMRGGDGAVWHYVWNGTAWSAESLGGGIVGSPEISSQGPGQLDVFARGLDNALWHRSFSEGSWGSWQNLGGNLTSSPGAVSWGPNRIDVVTRGSDNAVWHWVWNGVGWGLESLGGSAASAPDLSTLGPGYLDLFARGGDSLWHRSFNGGTWGPWVDLGVSMASSPSAVSWSNTRTDVVHLNSSGNLIHTYWSP